MKLCYVVIKHISMHSWHLCEKLTEDKRLIFPNCDTGITAWISSSTEHAYEEIGRAIIHCSNFTFSVLVT